MAVRLQTDPTPSKDALLHCVEEAEGIARSTLYGPTTRREAVQAITLQAAWSAQPYLLTGHALRMALELGMDRAMGRLESRAQRRAAGEVLEENEVDGRDLMTSARIWSFLS